MCEANIFLVSQGTEKELMKDVLAMETKDDRLILTNLLGEQQEVHARIKYIDFAEHRVILEDV